MAKQYESSEAFRQAIQARLRNVAGERGVALQDLQLKFLMERPLARLFVTEAPPWILKGGFAMELRYRPRARTTRDVDLSVTSSIGETPADRVSAIREQLQEVAEVDVGDHIVFRIGTSRGSLPGAPMGSARLPVDALLAGRSFGRFHLDVGIGDAFGGEPEKLVGDDFLGFVGIGPARVLALPKPQQFAEKLHAYTFPWTDREKTRVKDLVDMVLMVERGALDRTEVATAVSETFTRRSTHPVPARIERPPTSWESEFPAMARQAGLTSTNLRDGYDVVIGFLATSGP